MSLLEVKKKNNEQVQHLRSPGYDDSFEARSSPFVNLQTKYQQQKIFVNHFGIIVSFILKYLASAHVFLFLVLILVQLQ